MATKRKKETELPMELPRVPRAFEQSRMFRLRLPPDLSEQIEKEAMDTGLPQNRVIINRLARVTTADDTAKHADLNRETERILARYSAQQASVELGKNLLRAVDAILDAKPHELQARVEALRVERRGMQAIEQAAVRVAKRNE
jgi:hypothetical protein